MNYQKFYQFLEKYKNKNIPIKKINQFLTKDLDIKNTTEKELFNTFFKPLKIFMRNYTLSLNLYKFIASAIANYLWADFDYVVAITGTEGKGKSTLTLYIIQELKKLGINFSWDLLIMRYTSSKHVRSILKQQYSSLWFDEAKIYFDKRESMTRSRIKLNQEVTAVRGLNNVYFLCLGDIEEIDIYFRERRVRNLIVIPDRKIFINLLNLGIVGMGRDRFRLDYFNNIVLQSSQINYNDQISLLASLPSCYGVGLFDKPENTEYYKEYQEYYKRKKKSSLYIAPEKSEKLFSPDDKQEILFTNPNIYKS